MFKDQVKVNIYEANEKALSHDNNDISFANGTNHVKQRKVV